MDAEHSSTFALTPGAALWYAAVAVFRYLVLGLLRDGTARHGYALMKEYRERSGLQISNGNFYREVQRLVTEDLVRTAANPPGADPRRAPYEITEAGGLTFDAWLAAGGSPAIAMYEDDISARVLFIAEADPAIAQRLIDRWQETLWIQGKMLERAREDLLPRATMLPRGRFEALPLLIIRRLKHISADLDFLEALRRAYDSPAPSRSNGPQLRPRLEASARPARRQSRDPAKR